jgi:hypothetical protein
VPDCRKTANTSMLGEGFFFVLRIRQWVRGVSYISASLRQIYFLFDIILIIGFIMKFESGILLANKRSCGVYVPIFFFNPLFSII